jgi:sugar phosphate permease
MRGRAMGIAYVGVGVGGAIAPVLAQYLIRRYGWREAMLAISGMILLVTLPLAIALVKNRPADMGLHQDGDSEPAAPVNRAGELPPARGQGTGEINLSQAMRTRAFWLILTGSLMSIGAVGGVIQHLQLYLLDQHFTRERAAWVGSFLLVASILGRVTMGYLADKFSKKFVMLAACLMVACAIPLLYLVHVPGTVYLFAFIFGFGMGADYMLIPLITAECFGLASLGRLMGVILTTDALAQAFAPVVVGRIYDLQKSYDWGFAILVAMAFIGAAAVIQIPTLVRGGPPHPYY